MALPIPDLRDVQQPADVGILPPELKLERLDLELQSDVRHILGLLVRFEVIDGLAVPDRLVPVHYGLFDPLQVGVVFPFVVVVHQQLDLEGRVPAELGEVDPVVPRAEHEAEHLPVVRLEPLPHGFIRDERVIGETPRVDVVVEGEVGLDLPDRIRGAFADVPPDAFNEVLVVEHDSTNPGSKFLVVGMLV